MKTKFSIFVFFIAVFFFGAQIAARAQSPGVLSLTNENTANGKTVALDKINWKYRAGDDAAWAAREFDDADWETVENTTLNETQLAKNWRGRAWFRLPLNIDESLVGKNLALSGTQRGAAYIFLDGNKIAEFGLINADRVSEYNPNRLPVFFKFDSAGEHILAVRFVSETFADPTSGKSRWLTNGKIFPGFNYSLFAADDEAEVVQNYASENSMRNGFFFTGVLFTLALLHFLLYLFYRVERANFFYSLYAAAFGFFLVFNNIIAFGHQPVSVSVILRVLALIAFALTFIGLLAFLHVAFSRQIGKFFWILTAMWSISTAAGILFLSNFGRFQLLTNISIALTFSFCMWILVSALREKRSGAWILLLGLLCLIFGMTTTLLDNLNIVNINFTVQMIAELAIILGVPLAVSVFLARNFARTNRDLTLQLAQVETLSAQKIEQEKHAAELRAENERRARELEEARQLQLSMLPKKLPNIEGLDIAAYMKPATEVGGDYYDFYVGADGSLTVAVGDATGHGLKAGSVVTATKSLFNAFADQKNIPQIFAQTSNALKKMNLRGLFMAMTILKIKDNQMTVSIAGMPSALVYRNASNTIEEISIRAVPLGSLAKTNYQQQQIALTENDVVVLMSDGFPEMFNDKNEMLGFEKAAEILPEIAANSAQEIINELVKVGEDFANGRPQDDDVTFVVLKIV